METFPALSITGKKIYILSSLSFVSFHLNFLSLYLSLSLSLSLSLLLPFLFDQFWRSKASSPKSLTALSEKGTKQAHTCYITKLWAVVVLQI
jgi:hypothetical protein